MPQPRGQRSFSAKLPRIRRPAPPLKQQRSPAVRDYLRPDEVEAMVQAARKSGRHPVRDAAIILMMFRHGLRTAELIALRWQQVDLKAAYLDVCPSGEARTPRETSPARPAITSPTGTPAHLSPLAVCVRLRTQGALVSALDPRDCGTPGQGGRAPLCAPSSSAPACVRLLPRVART